MNNDNKLLKERIVQYKWVLENTDNLEDKYKDKILFITTPFFIKELETNLANDNYKVTYADKAALAGFCFTFEHLFHEVIQTLHSAHVDAFNSYLYKINRTRATWEADNLTKSRE